MPRKLNHVLLFCLAVLAAVACGGDDLTLDVGDERWPGFEDIERRLGITIREEPDDGTTTCNASGCTPEAFDAALYFACTPTTGRTSPNGNKCAEGVIQAERMICTAQQLLLIAETVAPRDVAVSESLGGTVEHVLVPPQDAESNAELARLASERAARALRFVSEQLDGTEASCDLTALSVDAGTAGLLTDLTIAEELAHFYREALEVTRDAADHMASSGLAVSDAAYSRRTDAAHAAQAALAPFASRTAAAHLLLGGATSLDALGEVPTGLPGIAGVDREGFFTRPRLSGEAQRALELIRSAAIHPVHVTNPAVEIDELVDGGATVSEAYTLRFRLGLMQARPAISDAASADAVYGLLGVSRSAFVEARESLREEIRAFDRSEWAILAAETLPEGDTTDDHGITLYAAIRVPPPQLLPSYWAAVLRYDPTPLELGGYTSYSTPPTWEWTPTASGTVAPGYTWGLETVVDSTSPTPPHVSGRRSIASILDEAVVRGPTIISHIDTLCSSGCDTGVKLARDLVAESLADFAPNPALSGSTSTPQLSRYDASTHLGRARACLYWWPGSYVDLRTDIVVPGLSSSELLFVVGRDGLECAVRGTLEGAPCTDAMLSDRMRTTPNEGGWQSYSGGFTGRFWDVNGLVGDRPTTAALSVFLVRRRSGYSGTPHPGQYEELTGWVLPRARVEDWTGAVGRYTYCQSSVIAPELDRTAAELIQPSTTEGHRPALSCAGLPSDMLIPLENELTDDGNGVESSWRHYLELARRAADEADMLGEDVIRSGLEMDLRAEAAADELSRVCGVTINLTSVASTLGGDAMAPAVSPTDTPPCDPPYVQQDTLCVLDPLLYAAEHAGASDDLDRLASCIGTDTVPWATLGDTPICMWDTDTGSPAGICTGAEPRMPCPYPADGAGGCNGPQPGGSSTIAVTDTIGIFQRPAEPVPSPPDPNLLPCEALARLRAGSGTLQDAADVVLSPLLTYDTMHAYGGQLTWEALVGDYSVVRYAGSVLFRTGSAGGGTGGSWPMGVDGMTMAPILPTSAHCPGGTFITNLSSYQGGPLFCLAGLGASMDADGNERASRARLNDLLARAVLAARIFSGNDLNDVTFPYYQRLAGWYQYNDQPSTFGWEPVTGSSPQAYYSPMGTFTLDRDNDDWDGPFDRQVSDSASRAGLVDGTPPGGACDGVAGSTEWATCRYDSSAPCLIFDDATDCDDAGGSGAAGYDWDVPLLLRQGQESWHRGDAQREATRFWREQAQDILLAGYGPAERRRPMPVDTALLTNYFTSEDASENRAFIGVGGLTIADFLNGLELTCVASRQEIPSADVSCSDPGDVSTIEGTYRLAAYFECRANALSQLGADSVIQNLPRRVVDALRQDGAGRYGGGAGEFDAQVSEIRAALIDLSNERMAAAADLRAFASRVRALRSAVARSERARRIETLMSFGNRLDRMTQCATAVANAITTDPAKAVGGAAVATATCVNSVAQIVLEMQIAQLRAADVEDTIIEEFARFNQEAADVSRRFSERATGTRAALERIDAALARIRSLQMQARRALARALLLTDDDTGAHLGVNAAMRTRYNTQLFRYRQAHQRAVRAAFIARLALEQRLGMALADIDDDVFSDEPPREWVDEICTLPSIDYDTIRASTPGATGERSGDGEDFSGPEGYSGAYVGDYVRRLEDVFESYSFVHPFREGTDTAVVSLRDDIFRTRAPCPTPTPNLLYNSGRLDVLENETRAGWRMVGCDPEAVPSGTTRSCVSATRLDGGDTEMPTGGLETADFGRAIPYRVSLGGTDATTADTRLEQVIVLPAGRYRLSWYARYAPTEAIRPDEAVRARDASGAELGLATTTVNYPSGSVLSFWTRYWRFFELASETEVHIGVAYGSLPMSGSPPVRDVDIAGVMLEDVTRSVVGDVTRDDPDYGEEAPPAPFFETGDSGLPMLRTCRDDDGTYFRREAWTRGCVRTCVDGYDGDCPPEWAESRCYWETSFDASSDDLQRRLLAGDAGFAAGNYNYRIESVAVNLVGTGLRDCEARGGTSGCYASGNLPFSLLHVGPFLVRNARGALYEAPIFAGRIESARALAAERYLSNPISSTDQALIQPYTRAELQGRPLDGTLVLRLWDDPAFVFDNVEDVQVILTYRYWQHQR